jgi:hypothetical protein
MFSLRYFFCVSWVYAQYFKSIVSEEKVTFKILALIFSSLFKELSSIAEQLIS